MANEAVGEFFALLNGDPELQSDLQSEVERAAAAAVIEVAARRGLQFTSDELEAQLANQVAELSEEELDTVAGGVTLQANLPPVSPTLAVATAGSTMGFLPHTRFPRTWRP